VASPTLNAIAIAGARYGILESARGCCGLPGDGSLHALRRWRQREPRVGRQLKGLTEAKCAIPASGATMHLPASAMQLDHQAGLDGCGTAEVMRRSGKLDTVAVH
jgi:hypothetical protein